MQYVYQISKDLHLQQMSALKAKKLYIEGKSIFVIPSAFTVDILFYGDAVRPSVLDCLSSRKEQFENFVLRYKHRNCCSLLGRGLHYFVKVTTN